MLVAGEELILIMKIDIIKWIVSTEFPARETFNHGDTIFLGEVGITPIMETKTTKGHCFSLEVRGYQEAGE